MTSLENFLLSLAYVRKFWTTARRKASISFLLVTCVAKSEALAVKTPSSENASSLTRSCASTSALTVPSESLSICKILAATPTSKSCEVFGSSAFGSRCVTKITRLSPCMAASTAFKDFARPTKIGNTVCGNTTTSRIGMTGETNTSGTVNSVLIVTHRKKVGLPTSYMRAVRTIFNSNAFLCAV